MSKIDIFGELSAATQDGIIADGKQVKNSYVVVQTLSDRDALSAALRSVGMPVYVVETKTTYRWDGTEFASDGVLYAEPELDEEGCLSFEVHSQSAENNATVEQAQGFAATAAEIERIRAEAAENALALRIDKTETDIEILNGDKTVDGSVDKKVSEAINAFAAQVTDDNTINTVAELFSYVAEHGGDAAEMAAAIDVLETKAATSEEKSELLETDVTALQEKVGDKSVGVQISENNKAILGIAGEITIAIGDWTELQCSKTFSELGLSDGIFFTPKGISDKNAIEDAEIFISTSSNSNTATFACLTVPTTDITLKYFIVRGQSV